MALQALQLPESVQSALDSIDRHLANIAKSINESFPENSKTQEWIEARHDLHAWLSELTRRRKAFESKAFFIVTFGMLKAGKSTLVNTFVGRRVSPVGRSKETTLRSSIILAADEDNPEGIYLYSPFEGAKTEEAIEDETLEQKEAREERNANTIKEWRVENCRKLVERLNGLDYDTGSLEEKRESYSLERLEYILTKSADELPDFPNILPPVIRINTDNLPVGLSSTNLLREGIAILDTPGLDGVVSNAKLDPFWDVLPACGDYFMLVQSSMSAINESCVDIILSIYKATNEVPILVVFNEIAADFYLKPPIEKEKLRKDSETASQQLSKILRQKLGGMTPPSISINAGEAFEAIFGNADEFSNNAKEMLDESRIVKLRENILETLREDRVSIKIRNSKDRLLKTVKDSRARFVEISTSLKTLADERKKATDDKLARIMGISSSISNAFRSEGDGVQIARGISLRLESWLKDKFDASEIETTAPAYKPHKGGANRDNHDYQNGQEVCEVLKKWVNCVNSLFAKSLSYQFSDHSLRVTVEPWKAKLEELTPEIERLKRLVDDIFTNNLPNIRKEGVDERFPDSLFKQFEEVNFFIPSKLEDNDCEIERVPWHPLRNRKYGGESVWECDCAKAVQLLSQKLRRHYPEEAAKQAASKLEKAILDKGESYAKGLAERIELAIKEAKTEEDVWQSENEGKILAIETDINLLDEISHLLVRI